jgi:hypothetical protein
MTQQEQELQNQMKDEGVLMAKVALVAVSEIPLAGGVISGLAGIALDELEPEPLNEDDVNRLIQKDKEKELIADYDVKVKWIKNQIEEIKRWNGTEKLEDRLDDFEEELDKICYRIIHQTESYDNAFTFYSLPYFVILANYHLLSLQMNIQFFTEKSNSTGHTYQSKYNEKIVVYTKYLNTAYHAALGWRWSQTEGKCYPSKLKPAGYASETDVLEFNDKANDDNNYDIYIHYNDARRMGGYETMGKHFRLKWWNCIKIVYNKKTGIEEVLANWLKKCPDDTIPNNWKDKIFESTLPRGSKLVRIKAKYESGKYLSHSNKDVHMKSASEVKASELFIKIVKDGRKGIHVLQSIGNNMGGFLSHIGDDSISIKFHEMSSEQWYIENQDLSAYKGRGALDVYAQKDNTAIYCLDSNNRRWYLTHNGNNLKLVYESPTVNSKYWEIEEVDMSKATMR